MYQLDVVSPFWRTVRFHLRASGDCPALRVVEHACWELLTVKESRTGIGPANRILLFGAGNFCSSPVLGLMNEEWLKARKRFLKRDGILVQVTTWAILSIVCLRQVLQCWWLFAFTSHTFFLKCCHTLSKRFLSIHPAPSPVPCKFKRNR